MKLDTNYHKAIRKAAINISTQEGQLSIGAARTKQHEEEEDTGITFRTAVSCWGQLGTNYMKFERIVAKSGLEF